MSIVTQILIKAGKIINKLGEQSAINRHDFPKHVHKVFNEYWQERTVQFEDNKTFHWVTLKREILRNKSEKSIHYISNHFQKNIFCENYLFIEIIRKKMLQMKKWNVDCLQMWKTTKLNEFAPSF